MTNAEAQNLLTRLTTVDAGAERKFTADSVTSVRKRTDALRALVAQNASVEQVGAAAVEMKSWACFGSLRAIDWLDRELDKLAAFLAR